MACYSYKKLWVVALIVAVMVVVKSSSSFHDSHWGVYHHSSSDGDLSSTQSCHGRVEDCIDFDEEMMVGSENNRRRLVGTRRYISYDVLKKNNMPCAERGQSYYNCRSDVHVNPYSRGCTFITHCARYMG